MKKTEQKKTTPTDTTSVEKKPVKKIIKKKVVTKPVEQKQEQPTPTLGLQDKILMISEIFQGKYSEEEILHTLKELDYDVQNAIDHFFEGKSTWNEVVKKEKKKAETKPLKKETRTDWTI